MDADRWRRVQHVLDAALTRQPGDWPALLDETCTGDPELRREVEALLGVFPPRVASSSRRRP